jgi:hypothetical protein
MHIPTLLRRTALALPLAAATLGAQTLTVSDITPGWQNVTGGTNVAIANSPADPITLRWGNSMGDGQSGYDFNDRATPFNVTLGSGGSARFLLGTFTHLNRPIESGTSISGAQLRVQMTIAGAVPATFAEVFQLSHEETPNGSDPCPYGGPNGSGVNQNGCADRVLVTSNITADGFTFGGTQYFLQLLGFSSSNASFVGAGDFLSRENGSNDAYLWAEITTQRPNIVPEPSTYALMATGLAGLAVLRRRRRA